MHAFRGPTHAPELNLSTLASYIMEWCLGLITPVDEQLHGA